MVPPVRPTPQPRLSLVCFPHAGGSASLYRSWGQHAPPDVDVLAVQYPGHEDRLSEPLVDDMALMADLADTALRATVANRSACSATASGPPW